MIKSGLEMGNAIWLAWWLAGTGIFYSSGVTSRIESWASSLAEWF